MKKIPIYTQDQVDLVLMAKDVKDVRETVLKIEGKLEKDYVTREEFNPIKNIVHLIEVLIITGVVGALLALVIKK